MRPYPVTTIGELGDCNCERPQIGAIADAGLLLNPAAWAMQKLVGLWIGKATGTGESPARPGVLDEAARALGVRPIELAIAITGYTGWGRYETAAKVVGGAAVVGAAALYLSRRTKKKPRKGKG